MNSPNNAAALRTLIIYAVCVPLAVMIGYVLTNPMDYSTLGVLGIVVLLLISPALLRWHHPMLILSWNLGMTLFFLKGSPNLWFLMVLLSLGISLLERALSGEMHFVRAPQITWPLLCLVAVALLTAKLTGGIGVRALGSNVYGGRKYVYLMLGIMSYFALTSRRIPPERVPLYIGMFFLAGLTSIISDLFPFMPGWSHFLYWMFPPSMYNFASADFAVGQTRLVGIATAGVMLWSWLMIRYGIRGIFLGGKLWRLAVFGLSLAMILLGGFRSQLLFVTVVFMFQFFAEGLHRTRMLPAFAWMGIMAMVIVVPLASKLPFTFQRALAFLPLDLDPAAKYAAQSTWIWRTQMWTALLPQVPKYFLLGKGLAITPEEYNEMMGTPLGLTTGAIDPGQDPMALSYDYHNGLLSVLIPFGIWGGIVVFWFFAAGLRVVYHNFRYGDPSLRTINTFFFAEFLVYIPQFIIGGSLPYDIARFAGVLGLSIAFNGGVCQPVPQPVPAKEPFPRPRGVLPRSQPRPAFPR